MQRVILHWTAGAGKANASDRQHYHAIIEDDGRIVPGNLPPEANAAIIEGRPYAAHTRNCNTGSVGVALAGMRGATERPFSPGPSPITAAQLDALAAHVAALCKRYRIPVTRETVLSHAEVQPTLGIAQRGQWDIAWLPGMAAPGNPVEVGDRLRALVRAQMEPPVVRPAPPPPAPQPGFLAALAARLRKFFIS